MPSPFSASTAILHSAAVAAADGAIMDVRGCATVSAQVVGITTATITWKVRNDGSNWVTVPAKNKATGVEATTATADGIYDIPVHGCTEFIADITAWTAGTITVTAVGTAGGVQSPHTSVAAVVGSIDTELPTAAALNGVWAKTTSAPIVGAATMLNDGTNLIQAVGGTGADSTGVQRVSLATNVGLPAGTNLLGTIVGFHATNSVYNGTTAISPAFAAIAAATSGDNTLVAADATKKIRVLSLMILAGAAGDIYFTSAAGGTVIFGGSTNKIKLSANSGFVLPFSPVGHFETAANQLLNLNASSTGPFSGGLVYILV